MSDAPDIDLVWQARKGDRAAVGSLYDRHQEAIYRFIWSRTGHPQLAEDLTGEVFTRMVKGLPSFDERGIPFRAWLYRIARNLLTDTYRRNGHAPHLPLAAAGPLVAENQPLEAQANTSITFARVRVALERIDPRQREVVELRFLAGLSLEETADTLDETIPTVKALQHRGLKALRALLPQEIIT